jgi:hypothetical protein
MNYIAETGIPRKEMVARMKVLSTSTNEILE